MGVAIIGCGISGMSAGITLQKAGIDTVIFEKNGMPGGVIAVQKKNILINNALEFVYGTAQRTFANDMWQNLGMFKNSPKHHDCFKTFLWNNHAVGVYKDFDKTVEELISISPQDKKRILRLGKSIQKFKKIEFPLITESSSNIFGRLFSLFSKCFSVIPDVLYYGTVNCKQYGKRFKSKALESFFSEALNKDRSVLQYIVLWSSFSAGNFSIPENNQQEMVDTLYNNYINSGGEVRFNSRLTDVSIKNENICALNFSDNTVTDFDFVIFSNDISSVNTIMNNSGKSFTTLERVMKKEHITSSCALYYSLDCAETDIRLDNVSIPCSPLRVGDRYLDIFSVRNQHNKESENPSLSVNLYQNEKDFLEWEKIRAVSKEHYEQEKHRISDHVVSAIEQQFPQMRGKLKLCYMFTPLTYQQNNELNYGGWIPESCNPLIYLRFGRGHMPGIKNASLIGQKVFPVGGTTIGAFSGVKLAEKLIKHKKL